MEAESIPVYDLGSRRELLFDGFLVDSLSGGAHQAYHQPQRQEVALVHDQPWEGSGSGYHAILPGFGRESCEEIFGDFLDRPVQWKERPDLGALQGKAVRLHFYLQEAEVFSFQIEKKSAEKSGDFKRVSPSKYTKRLTGPSSDCLKPPGVA